MTRMTVGNDSLGRKAVPTARGCPNSQPSQLGTDPGHAKGRPAKGALELVRPAGYFCGARTRMPFPFGSASSLPADFRRSIATT